MDLLLILTYTAICVAIFKIFKIPLNKWTVPTAVLGGIVLIGTLIFLMNYNHPYSEVSRSYFVSTPIVPAVSGLVVEVPVQGNRMLGAVLYGDTGDGPWFFQMIREGTDVSDIRENLIFGPAFVGGGKGDPLGQLGGVTAAPDTFALSAPRDAATGRACCSVGSCRCSSARFRPGSRPVPSSG